MDMNIRCSVRFKNPTGAADASATFRVTTKAIPYWANGINHLQANLAKRNPADDEQQYYNGHTIVTKTKWL